MTGFKSGGVDLDAILEPWIAGDGFAASTGHKNAGLDLNVRYAPAAAGTAYAGATGYQQVGVEVGPRFAGIGTRAGGGGVILPPGYDGGYYYIDQDSGGGPTSSSFVARINADGTVELFYGPTSHPVGAWHSGAPGADGSLYEVMMASTQTGGSFPAVVTNDAPTFSALSINSQISLVLSGGIHANKLAIYSVRIQIRAAGGATVSDGTFTVELEIENASGI